MSAGTTLLKLLQKVDSKRLETLLEPHVLSHLLEVHGHDRAVSAARLKRGETPGELLLALLEDHDAEALWAEVPAELRAHTEHVIREREKAAPVGLDDFPKGPLVLGIFGAVLPTMWALGAFPAWGSGVALGGVVFAVFVCGAAGAWGHPPDRLAAAATAATAAVASIFAGLLLAPYASGWMKLAVVVAMLPGALVGKLVWLALTHFRRDTEPETF